MKLKKDFERIIEDYGNYSLVIREGSRIPCDCLDEKTHEYSRECDFCFGLGNIPIIEKHKTRNMDTSVPETLAMLGTAGSFGDLAVPGRVYYMKTDCAIQRNDLIMEVDWDGDTPIYNGTGLYEISHYNDLRFLNGEKTFKKVYTKDKPVKKQIRAIKILNTYKGTEYRIAYKKG